MMLKLPITFESKSVNDADDCSWVGAQPLGERAHAQQDVIAGMLKDWANDLLPLGAELLDPFWQAEIRIAYWFWHGAIIYITHEIRGYREIGERQRAWKLDGKT